MKITGKIESYEGNNINIKGRSKPYFILPEDIKTTMENYPVGMIVTMTIETGTVKGMAIATPAESKSCLDDEKAGVGMAATPPPKERETTFKNGKELLQQNLNKKIAERTGQTMSESEITLLKARADQAAAEKAHNAEVARISKEATQRAAKEQHARDEEMLAEAQMKATPAPVGGIPGIVAATKANATGKVDVWTNELEEFKALLLSTKRDGIENLLKYLDESTDFYIAPSSTKYHNANAGGLLHHSVKVYHNLITLNQSFEGEYPEDTLILIGLLHDLCKANFYKTSTRNVKHENCVIPFCQCRYNNGWNKDPYIDIDDQFPLGHGEKSVILLQRYIKLTDIEIMAIRWHMMAYDDLHYSYAGNIAITGASSKYPVIVLMHMADLSASFLEPRKDPLLADVERIERTGEFVSLKQAANELGIKNAGKKEGA